MIKRVWIDTDQGESFDPRLDSADVLVETEDELMWSASFVTIPYLQRQMELSRDVANGVNSMLPVRFVAIETPHVIVEDLSQDTIEDIIDNLMTLGVFESVFVLYTEIAPEEGMQAKTDIENPGTTTIRG
jgi:hypothetical protein